MDKPGDGHTQARPGRRADRPSELPSLGWRDILWRVWTAVNEDRILLVAAGATFYLLLALFPFFAALVSLYGFVAKITNHQQ